MSWRKRRTGAVQETCSRSKWTAPNDLQHPPEIHHSASHEKKRDDKPSRQDVHASWLFGRSGCHGLLRGEGKQHKSIVHTCFQEYDPPPSYGTSASHVPYAVFTSRKAPSKYTGKLVHGIRTALSPAAEGEASDSVRTRTVEQGNASCRGDARESTGS